MNFELNQKRRSVLELILDRISKQDLFNIEESAKKNASILMDSDKSYISSVCGGWGSGKSTYLYHLIKHLQKNNEKGIIVFFNAWASAGANNISQSFLICFKNHIDLFFKNYNGTNNPFSSINTQLNSWFIEAISLFSSTDNKLTNQIIDKMTSAYDKSTVAESSAQDSLIRLKFNRLCKVLATSDFKVYVVIDEIDRCAPQDAVNIIENIRKYFLYDNTIECLISKSNDASSNASSPSSLKKSNVNYIISMDENYVAKCFMNVYNLDKHEAYKYLSKFIEHSYYIPNFPWDKYIKHVDENVYNLTNSQKNDVRVNRRDILNIAEFFPVYSNRERRRILAHFYLWRTELYEKELTSTPSEITRSIDGLLFLYAIVRVYYPEYSETLLRSGFIHGLISKTETEISSEVNGLCEINNANEKNFKDLILGLTSSIEYLNSFVLKETTDTDTYNAIELILKSLFEY